MHYNPVIRVSAYTNRFLSYLTLRVTLVPCTSSVAFRANERNHQFWNATEDLRGTTPSIQQIQFFPPPIYFDDARRMGKHG